MRNSTIMVFEISFCKCTKKLIVLRKQDEITMHPFLTKTNFVISQNNTNQEVYYNLYFSIYFFKIFITN